VEAGETVTRKDLLMADVETNEIGLGSALRAKGLVKNAFSPLANRPSNPVRSLFPSLLLRIFLPSPERFAPLNRRGAPRPKP
jgi:hypothetical protein